MNLIEITPVQLALCVVFVAIAAIGSMIFKLRLEKDLVWGTVRSHGRYWCE